MVGREISKMFLYEKKIALPSDKIALEVKTLSRSKLFKNVSFKLYRGEILGIYGLQGAGRTELVLLEPAKGRFIYLVKKWTY